jgi:hypothetical protein
VGTAPTDQILPKVDFSGYRSAMSLLPVLFIVCSNGDFTIRAHKWRGSGALAFDSL